MSNPNHHDIKVLNGLIETTLDSADGYREAAAETEDLRYQQVFEQRSFERRSVATDLQETVRALGGEPDVDGSILAKAQRAFTDVKHALMRDELTVVSAVESGEDRVKARFEKALEDSNISATTRETIRRAYASVADGHGQMRDLKHSLEGRRDADSPLFPQ